MTYRALLIVVTMCLQPCRAWPSTQAPDAARIAAAKQMMELAGSAAQFDQVMPLMSQQMSQAFKNIAPGNATEIDDVFRQLVPKFIERKGELLDQIATLYATEMTLDELNAIVAFYRSPVGAEVCLGPAEDPAQLHGAGTAMGPEDRRRIRRRSAPRAEEARHRSLVPACAPEVAPKTRRATGGVASSQGGRNVAQRYNDD